MPYARLLVWLTNDPTATVTLIYWLAASLTMIMALALVVVAISGFRRALAQASAGPFRPGLAVEARGGPGLFQASAREAFHASLSAATSDAPAVPQSR